MAVDREVLGSYGEVAGAMGTDKVWVVIPAHNEGASIGDVVRGVRRAFNAAVVAVDDFSTDHTALWRAPFSTA